MTWRVLGIALLGCGLAVALGPANAADIRWRTNEFQYTTVEPRDLRTFLREFASQQGMAVSIDPEVKGEFSGRYKSSPRELMEQLARTYGLVYYFDGSVLHIAPSTAVESEVIRLNEKTPAEFQVTLERLGISDARYPLTVDPQGNVVKVSGPRRMVELVRQAATNVEARTNAGVAAPVTATKVFPLQFAFAEDHLVRAGGKEYRVAGLASVLRQIFGASAWRNSVAGSVSTPTAAARRPSQPAQSGTAPALPLLQAGRRGDGAPSADAEAASTATEEQVPAAALRNLPTFTAEPRTNAIIVRDIPARLDAYDDLIQTLDKQPMLVELEVNIIEINADDFATLGIDWKALGGDGAFEVGSGSVAANATNPRGTSPDPTLLPNTARAVGGVQGAVFSLLMGNRSQLIARISALERGGRAKVQAQPRVTTLNNIEAVLESINTFYVRVQGFQDAQLFDINVGTAVRLTPSVVAGRFNPEKPEERSQLVRMLVRIEDGSLTEQSIEQLPLVQRSNIGTQALVTDGATLLIAGYSQERTRSIKNEVPLLSSLPVVGNLFKSSSTSTQRLEKLFMITPRVVPLNEAAIAKPAPLQQPAPVERGHWQ